MFKIFFKLCGISLLIVVGMFLSLIGLPLNFLSNNSNDSLINKSDDLL